MAAKCSIVPDVVWNWVVEALASYKETYTSTLIGLAEMAPAISGDAGIDTREIVSLRILESLFDHGNEATVDAKNPKISFESSVSCQDVLKKILCETHEQMDRLEKEKWDVGSFLKHKRSSLPNCRLKKLKEMILDDSNPRFASLKEKSKIVTSNASEDAFPANDVLPPNLGKDKNEFQENVLQDDHVHQEIPVDDIENLESVFKYKDSNNTFQPNNGRLNGEISNALPVSSVASEDTNQANDENMPQDTHTNEHNKRVSAGNIKNLEFVVMSKDSNKSVQPHNERVNDDGDERTDIAARKEAFLKSQCTTIPDSVTLTELSEIDHCMKCNKRGELLVCSSDSCPIRIHKSCLGSAVALEENGEFFCPFCACSRAISKYEEAKINASRARKNFQAFSTFTLKLKPNMENEKDSSFEQTTELPENPILEQSTLKHKSKEKESQQSTESSLRKRKANHIPQPSPSLRRIRLAWTEEEEETLKEGVKRYYANANNTKKISWTEILDFGRDVFLKGRTAVDLKDKWRNICK